LYLLKGYYYKKKKTLIIPNKLLAIVLHLYWFQLLAQS
jgi:hypothetical protein